jgi:hypothetical protein
LVFICRQDLCFFFFVCFWIHTMYNRYPGGSFHANLASQ